MASFRLKMSFLREAMPCGDQVNEVPGNLKSIRVAISITSGHFAISSFECDDANTSDSYEPSCVEQPRLRQEHTLDNACDGGALREYVWVSCWLLFEVQCLENSASPKWQQPGHAPKLAINRSFRALPCRGTHCGRKPTAWNTRAQFSTGILGARSTLTIQTDGTAHLRTCKTAARAHVTGSRVACLQEDRETG